MSESLAPEKAYALLSEAAGRNNATVRDDQHEFSVLLDAARISRQKRLRFRLIDTGKLDFLQLEWLGEAGADIYTSDEARPKASELDLIRRACSKKRRIVAFFFHGLIEEEGITIARTGVYLYLSNREKERDPELISRLSQSCRKEQSWLVYYHHGPVIAELEDLARNGTWIHVSDRNLHSEGDVSALVDAAVRASENDAGLVLSIERGMELSPLRDLSKAGAHLLFKTPPSDSGSPLKGLEKEAARKKLDFRAYYLYPTFLP